MSTPALGPDGAYRSGTFQEEVALAWHNVAQFAAAVGYPTTELARPVHLRLGASDDRGDIRGRGRPGELSLVRDAGNPTPISCSLTAGAHTIARPHDEGRRE